MGNKYYDTLQVLQIQEAQRNELGDLLPASENWQAVSPCRDEPAGEGATVNVEGGAILNYSSNVFCPASCPDIQENITVKVMGLDGREQVTGTVKRFKRYRHYAKIWV
jgi:hypothetical protein